MWKLYFPVVVLFLILIEDNKNFALSQEILYRQLLNTRPAPAYFYPSPPQSSSQFQYTSANTTSNSKNGGGNNGQGRELIKLVRRQKHQFEFPPNFQFPSNSFTGRSAAGSSVVSSSSAAGASASPSSPWSAVAKRAVGLLHHFPRSTTTSRSTTTTSTTPSPGTIFRITKSVSSTFEPNHKPTLFSYNYQRYSNQSQSQTAAASQITNYQKPFRPSKHLSFPKRNLLPKLPTHVRLGLSSSTTTTTTTDEPTTTTTTEEPSPTEEAELESGETGSASGSIEVSDSQPASAFPFQLFNRTRIIRKRLRPRPVYRRKLSSESKSTEAEKAFSVESQYDSIIPSSLSPVPETTTLSPVPTSKSTIATALTSTELPRMPLVSSEEVTEVHISPGVSMAGDNIAGNTEYIVITNAGGGAEVVDRFNPIIASQGQANNGHDSISVRSRHYHDYHQFPPMPMQHQHQHQHQEHQQVHYHHPPHKKVQPSENSLMPLDKTLVYVGMITSWMFWIVVFTWYYFWNNKSLLDSNYSIKQQLQQQNQFFDPSHGKTDSQSNNEILARRVILNINDFGSQHKQQPGLAAATVQIQPQGQQQQQILTAPVLIPQIFEPPPPPPQQQQFYQQQQGQHSQFRHIIQKR